MTAPGGFADTLRREKLRFMDRSKLFIIFFLKIIGLLWQ